MNWAIFEAYYLDYFFNCKKGCDMQVNVFYAVSKIELNKLENFFIENKCCFIEVCGSN